MKHWLFMFRPETFRIVLENSTLGVRDAAHVVRRFREIESGDRLVSYISRNIVFDGYGAVTSEPFFDGFPMFGEAGKYPHRVRVSFDRTAAAKPAGNVLWALSPFRRRMETSPANLLTCWGGFCEISEKEYADLVVWMDGPADTPWGPALPGGDRVSQDNR